MSREDVVNSWDGVLDLSTSAEDAAALEIGRAMISAQRAASAIIAEARRHAGSIAEPGHAAIPTSAHSVDLIRASLEREVDEIERDLAASQSKLLSVLTAVEAEDQPLVQATAVVRTARDDQIDDDEVVSTDDDNSDAFDDYDDPIVSTNDGDGDVMTWGAPDPTRLVQVTIDDENATDLRAWGAPDPTGLVQAAPRPEEAPPDQLVRPQAAEGQKSVSDRLGASWIVNAVATAVVIVVLVITLLLVNTI
jgi:hypothetical protein